MIQSYKKVTIYFLQVLIQMKPFLGAKKKESLGIGNCLKISFVHFFYNASIDIWLNNDNLYIKSVVSIKLLVIKIEIYVPLILG